MPSSNNSGVAARRRWIDAYRHQDVLIRREQRRLVSAQARHTEVEILSYVQQWQEDLAASEPHYEVYQALASALQEPSRLAAWHGELSLQN
jgi:hypothetical protein